MKLPGFIGGAYTLRSVNFQSQRCINLYVVKDEVGHGLEGNGGYLAGTPGKRLVATAPNGGPIRGEFQTDTGLVFVVSGNKFYLFDTVAMTLTEKGTLSTGAGVVGMAFNGVQVMIVDGLGGYIYTVATGVFAVISDADMPNASHVEFIDGYFILNNVGTDRFYITALYDGYDIDGLDFGVLKSSPGSLVSMTTLRNQLWVFGLNNTQVYYNSGDPSFPFSEINGVFMDFGCVAPYSVCRIDQTVMWLGSSNDGAGIVYMANGFQPQRVSTTAIEIKIQSYADMTAAKSYAYQQEGATFYCLIFSETVFVYEINTGVWHERCEFVDGEFIRDRAENHVYSNGLHLVGDYENGNIYALDLDFFTSNGNVLKRLRTSPHASKDGKFIYYNALEVECEYGVGTNTGQGLDPKLIYRHSNDGGHTYSSERLAPIGKIGETKKTVKYTKCGRARSRTFETSITDPVKIALFDARIDFKIGSR